MENQIDVSVYCLAYNHEKYIRKCLEGFIMQEGVRFEVIIHDDASTDGTTKIIQEFESKYPDIIKPIYQTENQYSKGVSIRRTYIIPRIRGKYTAICEGDDYWTDKFKLFRQFKYMESNPECGICVHQATRHNCYTNDNTPMTNEQHERDYSIDEVILGGGALFATNSVLMNTEAFKSQPECFQASGFGDYQLFMYGAIVGTCHYLPDIMSVYNCGTEGSWTVLVEKNRIGRINSYDEMIRMLNCVDDYYKYVYHVPISEKILDTEFRKYILEGKLFRVTSRKYKKCYLEMKCKGESPIKDCLVARFPWLPKIKDRLNHEK